MNVSGDDDYESHDDHYPHVKNSLPFKGALTFKRCYAAVRALQIMMLRKLKQQVTQAVNAVNPNENRHETLINEEDGNSEGFLCPLCMRTFTSPEELQTHFGAHSDNEAEGRRQSENSASSSFSLPTDISNGFNGLNTFSAELEVKAIRSSIRDEKRYSSELKKELERLHAIVANADPIPEGEVPYLMQQVQMLESGKSMGLFLI
ncbi:Early endosome antigen 1 [Toxocara canis]|uniref:Early endosome antigen 1 n=1 Tax=Toxocara canis TaxID=6265 RepID=A0A0B2VPM2_TOXCA|nr:Early endosome antigen 1 [Toxocara canis]